MKCDYLTTLHNPNTNQLRSYAHNAHNAQGDLARVINNFLEMADRVQILEVHNKLEAVAKLPVEKQAEARAKIEDGKVDYLTQPMLADLEQGWGDPKKVYLSVIRCLQNGVNIMHIEVRKYLYDSA